MRILIHDYGGYPFTLDLSRELARRGHQVWHVHFQDMQQLKAGCMAETKNEGTLTILGLSLGEPFDKYSLVRRRSQDLRYAKLAAGQIAAFRPEVVLSGNTPLEVQKCLHIAARKVGARFYFWVQDFYSIAVWNLLAKRLPVAGRLVGYYYTHLERRLLRGSEGVVLISSDFLATAKAWGLDPGRCHVIENWAPLQRSSPRPTPEEWKAAHGLTGKRLLLYSGTLGMKHNPSLLVELARAVRDQPDVVVAVVSAGPGADWLKSAAATENLGNLQVLPFQPIEKLPDMLAAAEVLLGILDQAAGAFSVPSKVLTYLAAGKPTLLSIPRENLAARTISRIGAGIVSPAGCAEEWVDGALTLLRDRRLRERCSQAAARYAREAFDVGRIASQFEGVFSAKAGTVDLSLRQPVNFNRSTELLAQGEPRLLRDHAG
jgi:colanic acid biosynthesis glycosyl transferase WcaI